MEEMRELAGLQDGVIYLEQFEEWVERTIERLKEGCDESSDASLMDYRSGVLKVIEVIRGESQ